jgi:4-amino-4-deoxy-L-arabinose transferase-like glycosyltransferase
MLQILLVVPALAALHLLGSTLPWRRRLIQAALALLVAAVISAAWVLAVELTPPGQRPYVGGSTTNSMVELVFWYNGAARLWAQDFSYFLGQPSPLRLFNEKLAGQASWLLPFGLIGLTVAAWQVWRGPEPALQLSRRWQALILWATWLLVPLVYLSISLFYHRYYLSTMAPAIAALVGIGASALWAAWRAGGRGRWWAIAALLVCAGVQVLILAAHPDWGRWLSPTLLALCLAALAVLVLPLYLGPATFRRSARAAFTGGILALLIAPTVWALIPVLTCTDMTLPIGGPQAKDCRPFATMPFLDPALVAYLQQHRDGARFLAATYDLGIAELGILETGEPFMALGGYRGSDPILTADQFARLVAEGQVHFFLSMEDAGEEWPQQAAIRTWVDQHCPASAFQSQGVQVQGPCMADG